MGGGGRMAMGREGGSDEEGGECQWRSGGRRMGGGEWRWGGGGEGDGDEEDGDGAGWRSGRRSVTMVMGREEGGDRDGGV